MKSTRNLNVEFVKEAHVNTVLTKINNDTNSCWIEEKYSNVRGNFTKKTLESLVVDAQPLQDSIKQLVLKEFVLDATIWHNMLILILSNMYHINGRAFETRADYVGR